MKIKHASQLITLAIVLLSLLSIACVQLARHSSRVAFEAQEIRRRATSSAERLAAASDRLTNDVRAFASTGDPHYRRDFEREVSVDRNRERAVEELLSQGLTEDEQVLLTGAKERSDRLVRLENEALAAAEKGDTRRAIALVYGSEYTAAKTSIMWMIDACRERLVQRLTDHAVALQDRAGVLDEVALVTVLLNTLCILGALLLFYRRRVINPLAEIAGNLHELAERKAGASIAHQRDTSEIGEMARAIEKYRLTVEEADRQRWVKSSVSDIADALLGTEQPNDFARSLLGAISPLVGAESAAFHLYQESDDRFHPSAGIGHRSDSEPFPAGRGVCGEAAAERRLIEGAEGCAVAARSVWAVPLVIDNKPLAVMEFGAASPPSPQQTALLHDVAAMATIKLDALQRNLHMRELLDQLRASERDLRHMNFLADTALDLTRSGYWHVPLDGSGQYNSSERAARIFGDPPVPDHRYTLAHWEKHVFAGDEEAGRATMENFSAAVAGTIPAYDATYAYERPVDGRVIWIHALGHVVKDADGKPTDMYGVTQDVTDFKMLEKALVAARQKAEEASQMKSMFLANMSHEIRTPMNAIIGLSHLALRTRLDAKQRDYLSKIHNAGTSLLAVINDILDFSKVEAGKLDLETTEFRLDDVIHSVAVVTSQKAHEKGLEFLVLVPPTVPVCLLGDPLRLGQILTNLVNNAVKFTERGEVRLRVELLERTGEKCQVRFSVEDTGIGMTREQANRLFQPFTQADMSTTRKYGGTGLGLTISRRLVELMGGQIWLDSEPGRGTTFSFTAWLGVGDPTTPSRVIPERLARLRVLVVDDNLAASEIIAEGLRGIVASVSAVASGAEAVAAVQRMDASQPYDIVYMDWQMPGMDGIEAAGIIRGDASLGHPPAVVLVTAYEREEVRDAAERLRLDGFLLKPVTRSMLVDSLVDVVGAPTSDGEARAGSDGFAFPGLRVLLVEDNEINQQIAVELLEGVGASVEVADNGAVAVDKILGGGQYDVVLMDLQMPVMDGHEATARIRAEARFAGLPILAMTAHATTEERQRCLDEGMNDHVSKPIDPTLFFTTLSRYHAPSAGASLLPAPSAQLEIPDVEGLDATAGLARVGGNRALYLKLLGQFMELEHAPSQIGECLAAGDWPTAERLAHTVNGVAANLGIGDVQRAAATLEKALQQRSDASDLLVGFTDVLRSFIDRLRAALPAPAPARPSSAEAIAPARMADALEKMAQLLDTYDPEATELFETERAVFSAMLSPAALATFEAQLAGFAFADALVTLREGVEKQEVLPS